MQIARLERLFQGQMNVARCGIDAKLDTHNAIVMSKSMLYVRRVTIQMKAFSSLRTEQSIFNLSALLSRMHELVGVRRSQTI